MIHDWPKRLLAGQIVLAALLAPWYSVAGLAIDWRSAWLLPLGHLALAAAWLYSRRYAAHPRKFIFGDVLLATLLLVLLTNIVSPAQYLAVALHRPLIDGWLVRADALVGIDVAALARWTAAHGSISLVLSVCYASLLPQFMLPIVLLGLRHRDRAGLWEYVFHFHFCLLFTLAALALFPAACAFTHLGFTSTIDQSRFISQFTALRDGTLHRIDFGNLEGLISMPSFHAAGALMVTWAFRRHRRMLVLLGVLNTGLIAATFMSGAHYFVDVVASGVLFGASVACYRVLAGNTAVHASGFSLPGSRFAVRRSPFAVRDSQFAVPVSPHRGVRRTIEPEPEP